MRDGRSAYERRLARGLLVAGCAMLPWLYLLARWLPETATAAHWSTAWIGLDGAEGLGLLLTGLLLRRGDPRVALTAAATATLLCVDAWFDVATSGSDSALALAVTMAVALELPAAVLCAALALRAVTPDGAEVANAGAAEPAPRRSRAGASARRSTARSAGRGTPLTSPTGEPIGAFARDL